MSSMGIKQFLIVTSSLMSESSKTMVSNKLLIVVIGTIDEDKEPEREVFKIKVLVLVSLRKVILQGDERHPLNIKVQLSSDHDIFFLFETVLNEDQYKVLQVSQGLHAEFSDFP